MTHTCSYCDGTLNSVRPPCGNCGHALCDHIDTKVIRKIHDYLFGVPRTYEAKSYETVCPKCRAINKLNSSFSVVLSYEVYL